MCGEEARLGQEEQEAAEKTQEDGRISCNKIQGRLGVWVSERAQSVHQKGQCAWA